MNQRAALLLTLQWLSAAAVYRSPLLQLAPQHPQVVDPAQLLDQPGPDNLLLSSQPDDLPPPPPPPLPFRGAKPTRPPPVCKARRGAPRQPPGQPPRRPGPATSSYRCSPANWRCVNVSVDVRFIENGGHFGLVPMTSEPVLMGRGDDSLGCSEPEMRGVGQVGKWTFFFYSVGRFSHTSAFCDT